MKGSRPDIYKTNNLLNQQGKRDICYDNFLPTVDDSIKEIVALASTLSLTCAPNIMEENEQFYGDEFTDWSNQHYKVMKTQMKVQQI